MAELRHRKPAKKIETGLKSQPEETEKKKVTVHNNSRDGLVAIILFFLSLPIRFKHLGMPSQVLFDEAHFGKYAGYYIKQMFFFDIHPPLAKLLISLIAWISGFDGEFNFFGVGSQYPKDVPYVQMRALGALLSSFTVPLAYLTIRNAGHSKIAGVIAALAICFENGLITNNRLILLDSYLLFFTAFSIFAWTKFLKQRPFSRSWCIWLLFTGISLGCAVSSKWAGLFTIIFIGLSALQHLWAILGDIRVTKRQYAVHLFARFACLVVIPVAIYIGSFYLHFSILTKPGPGINYMTIETQSELKGIPPVDTQVPITYGSYITIRHRETTGGYLHSHFANYPEGSNQQQITLYPYKDTNNWWRILKADPSGETQHDLLANDNETWLEYVRNGDLIRLEHVTTAPRKLHSHDFPAPITDTDYHREVSGYGFVNHTGDSNDFWRVQIFNNTKHPEAGQHLEARRSEFQLLHTNQDCHLYANFERLPEWGFGQQEVSCIQDGLRPRTTWMIDETDNDLLPDNVPIEPEARPRFFEKLCRLHKHMWATRKEVVEDHPYDSKPASWPLLQTQIAFWFADTTQIFMFGNLFVYGASTLAVLVCIGVFGVLRLADKRHYVLSPDHQQLRVLYETSVGFFVCGWVAHYAPYYLLKHQQLFLHHYLPALYLAVLALGATVDVVVLRSRPVAVRLFMAVLMAVGILYVFSVLSPITYGEPWSVTECQKVDSLSSAWNMRCQRYAPLDSFERIQLVQEESDEAQEDDEEEANDVPTVYVDTNGNHISLDPYEDDDALIEENEDPFTSDDKEGEHDHADMEEEEEEDDDEDLDEPTEAPVYEEPDPQFIDGKEVFGEEEEDEDDYPRTEYGVDPEADEDEDPKPLVPRDIPLTRHED
ncbi:MAG: Dolichyl-phosphate-mannose-protein mannosyltransferase-domain-containing protein [Benjaminiella poitrasii]|nr:MAG: Dolichyl-phosphate-mannose-protein mannosyltransferase-domain-containing protein [Benjaminiella poitrasii]